MSEPARVSDRPRATPRVSDELVNALVTEGIREGALSDNEAGKFVVSLLADLRDAREANAELAELVRFLAEEVARRRYQSATDEDIACVLNDYTTPATRAALGRYSGGGR